MWLQERLKNNSRKDLLVFFFLLLIHLSIAQDQEKIQSYRQSLRQADSAARYDLWSKISFEYRNSFPDSTIIYGQRAYALGKRLGLKKNLARPLSFIGLGYGIKGDRKKSLDYHEQAIKIAFDQQDSIQVGYAYNNLGRLFLEVADNDRAEQNFSNAIQVFERIHDQTGLAYAYRSLSEVELNRKNYPKALDLADRAYKIRLIIDDQRAVISSLLETGSIYKGIGEKQSAWRHLLEAYELASKLSDPETISEVQVEMADAKYREGDLVEAMKHNKEVRTKVLSLFNESLKLRYLLLSAKIFIEAAQYKMASDDLDQAIQVATRNQNLLAEKEALELRIRINERIGAQQANPTLRLRLDSIKDILERREQARETERLYFQLLVEKSENENQNLKLQLAQEEVMVAKQQSRNSLIILIALTFVAGSLLLYLFLIRQRKQNALLKTQNEKILRSESEIQAANDRLGRQNKELQELAAEKDSLMGIMAHDLRTPLNHIMGFAQLIEFDGTLSSRQKEYAQRIKKSVDNGVSLIQDILDSNHYRVEEKLILSDVSLKDFSSIKKKEFESQAASKNISFLIVCEGLDIVYTEPNFLNRICDNMISNDIKISPHGGEVVVSFRSENDFLELMVSDSGPGFTAEDRQEMFKQFKTLSARPTGGEPSNGLGLAIVKSLLDRLKGEIQLQSVPGQGACFTIRLPNLKHEGLQ